MRIHRRWFTVCSPTCVGYSNSSSYVLILTELFQVSHLTLSLVYAEVAIVVYHSDARAIVSSILQSFKTLNENREDLSFTYISYNTTHIK